MHAGSPTLEVLASPQTPPRTRQSILSPKTRPLSPPRCWGPATPADPGTEMKENSALFLRVGAYGALDFWRVAHFGGTPAAQTLPRWGSASGLSSVRAPGCQEQGTGRCGQGAGGCGAAFQAASGSQEMPPDWVLGPLWPWGAAGWSWPTGLGQPSIPQGVVRGCLWASCWCTLCALGAEMRCCCHLLGLGSRGQWSLLALSTQESWGAPEQAPCSFMVWVGATVSPRVTRHPPPPRGLCESGRQGSGQVGREVEGSGCSRQGSESDLRAPCTARAHIPLCRLTGRLWLADMGEHLLPALRRGFCPGTPRGRFMRTRGHPTSPSQGIPAPDPRAGDQRCRTRESPLEGVQGPRGPGFPAGLTALSWETPS